MLPFTKRPGRGDESGDHDVVTKDDLVTAETINPTANARAKEAVRAKFSSLSDDEMTNIMPSKSIGDALESARAAAPRPAAGMPPPSSARTQARPSPTPSSKASVSSATRSGKFAAVDDEEEDGRTVVRGAPKIVKRAPGSSAKMGMPTSPTTISPAAVIKATLEAARAGKRTGDHLMAPPPKDLLEDMADLLPHPADGPGSEHTKILMTTGSNSALPPPPMHGAQTLPLQSTQMAQASLPPASTRPMSNAPPPMVGHTTNASGGYPAQQSGGYAAQYNGPVPSGSVSAPGVAMPASMPAHFMVPQPPYSDGRIDPPGTAVTARTKVAGRPAMSWAMAVMAFGLFVGVGAFAVMKGNGSEGFMETSASFVDPARAGAAPAAKAAAAAAAPVAPTPVPVAAMGAEQPSMVGVPGVAVPAPAVAGAAGTTGAAGAVTTAPVAGAAGAAGATGAIVAPTTPAAPAPAVAAITPPAATTARRPHFRPSTPAADEPAPTAKPAPVAATPAPATAKPRGGAGPKGAPANGNSPTDEEQRAALKALQDSQLERSLGQ